MSELATCPFNPAHTIAKRKLQNHIEKCKKTASNFHLFAKCQYGYHYFLKGREDEHYEGCKDAQLVMSERALWTAAKFTPAQLVDNVPKKVADDEAWETETGPAFEPAKLAETAPHMTLPQGMSKSKRKAHRESERERLRTMEGEREKKFMKEEPAEPSANDEEPSSRAPTSRIAARFKATHDADSKERNSSSMSAASFSTTSSIQATPSAGRGRGLLMGGWLDNAPTVGNPGHVYKSEDFPELGERK